MLHEILLSLSGQPSPLVRTAVSAVPDDDAAAVSLDRLLSPPERALLAHVAHLSDLHAKLLAGTAQTAAEHPSTICRAVAAAIEATHLAAFQKKVLDVEADILRKDAALVGAYNIVPLTAVVGEFDGWIRRMEWLWELGQFMAQTQRGPAGEPSVCTGAALIDRLRGSLQTGYADIEETARSLVRAAEMAWLKQVSAWVLYGSLPSFGAEDFCIQRAQDDDENFTCVPALLPSLVTRSTAASMLFIGRSLNHLRTRSEQDLRAYRPNHISSQLKELSGLTSPLDAATYSRVIARIRRHLSRTTLQKLLPLRTILEILQVFRDFFLLGRGEFAVALVQEADERIRSRWRRADHFAFQKLGGLATMVVKEGEVSAVLDRTWATLGSMRGQHAEEDEGLERARDLLQLVLPTTRSGAPKTPRGGEGGAAAHIDSPPFMNLLFSVPVTMTLSIASPLDLFLSQSDLQTYTTVHSYLLAIRRAQIRLTDLWKITPLRRHHPPPPGPPYSSTRPSREKVVLLRERYTSRSNVLRNTWATASAAIFFLSETEAYLQNEVVAGLWEGFERWLTTGADESMAEQAHEARKAMDILSLKHGHAAATSQEAEEVDDIWLAAAAPCDCGASSIPNLPRTQRAQTHPHDPQTLATAHRRYLTVLVRRLLLNEISFTEPLYELLVQIDQLIALVHRLHTTWTSADFEADAGVADAFIDVDREEREVRLDLGVVSDRLRHGIEGIVAELRALESRSIAVVEDKAERQWGPVADYDDPSPQRLVDGPNVSQPGDYVPSRVGGVHRLLMKLDFGTWFGVADARAEHEVDEPWA